MYINYISIDFSSFSELPILCFCIPQLIVELAVRETVDRSYLSETKRNRYKMHKKWSLLNLNYLQAVVLIRAGEARVFSWRVVSFICISWFVI